MKKLKKGFTLLELVIVIAVFAILAAILIPTFASMLRRARISNDIILVKNLNTIAFANEQENGKSKTASDALVALAENGYIVDRLTPTADNAYILWDSVNDRFVLWDKGKITFHDENTKILENSGDYWLFTDDYSETITKNLYYSVYLKEGYAGETLDICTGLDVGENANIQQINYEHNGESQNVVICTNGGNLKIDAKNDNVTHYGYSESVNVVDIATASYHESGEVKFLEVSAGHVVLEENASVSAVHFTATGEGDEAKFENADGKKISIDLSKVEEEKLPSFSRDAVTIEENGTYVAEVTTESTEYIWLFGQGIKEQMVVTSSDEPIAVGGALKTGVEIGAEDGSIAEQIANPAKRNENGELVDESNEVIDLTNVDFTKADALEDVEVVVEQVASKEDVQTGATLFGGGSGTENDPYMIRCREYFENIDVVSGSFKYFVVDVESELWSKDSAGNKYMDATGWITIELNGVLYGNNLKIKNLSNTLFDMEESDSDKVHRIEKLDIDCAIYKTTRASALLVDTPVKLELDSIYVHGIIQGSQVGSFVLFVEDCGNDLYLHIKNCQSDANLIGTTNANGFFSHIYLTTRNINDTIKIENSQFIGSLMTNVEAGKACYIGDNTGGTRKGGITFEVDEASRFYNGVSLVNWESYESTSGNRRVALDPYTYTVNGVVQKQSLNKIDNTALPDKYAAFSVAKNTSATSAKAVFVIAPNGNGTTVMGGGFDSTYMKEDSLELTDGYYMTDLIKYFDIEINGSTSVSKEYAGSSGLSSDGRTFNVINSSYGHNYSSAQVVIIQYNGTAIVQIDVFNLPK